MIHVYLNHFGTYSTDAVYQWDQNHTLNIEGENSQDVTTVHFTNKSRDKAIVCETTDVDGVKVANVPNELLEEPYDVIAYIHVYNDNHAKTVEIINIPLIKRAKPTDYQFVDNVPVMTFERLEKDIKDFIALSNDRYTEFTNDTNDNIETFKDGTNNTIAEYKTEMDTTLQACRDAVSALQLEYRQLDGGTPTTEEELYDDNYNGGYPVNNG